MQVRRHNRNAIATLILSLFLLPLGVQAAAVSLSFPLAQNPPSNVEPDKQVPIAEVAVSGAEGEIAEQILQVVETKPGQATTRSQLQEDINAIFALGYFAHVKVTPEDTDIGVRVTFAVELNPVLRRVEVEPWSDGNSVLSPEALNAIFQPQYNRILNLREFQSGIQALIQWYKDNGYAFVQVVGQPEISEDGIATLRMAEGRIEGIEVKFFNLEGEEVEEGAIAPAQITEAMQLKAGSVFNREAALQDLLAIRTLGSFEDVQMTFEVGKDPSQAIVIIQVTLKVN